MKTLSPKKNLRRRAKAFRAWSAVRSAAFTLIEMMVVMVLLSVIVLGLMAMFDQTQRTFRAGLAQTDQLEAGRMFSDTFVRELQQITPSDQTNGLNFYTLVPNYQPLQEVLPASTIPRTNILQDLFFISRYNQTWKGIGYFVRTNPGVGSIPDILGSLYRFETNMPMAQFQGAPLAPYFTFLNATNFPNLPSTNVSKILDGVVQFRVRSFDLTNNWITNGITNIVATNYPYYGEPGMTAFSNNAVPAYVEIELGVLEPAVLKKFNSIPDPITRSNFLANHAGNVQLFRQRVAIRNVDPSAYTQPQ